MGGQSPFDYILNYKILLKFNFAQLSVEINVCFWKIVQLLLPKPNINTYFSLWAKC